MNRQAKYRLAARLAGIAGAYAYKRYYGNGGKRKRTSYSYTKRRPRYIGYAATKEKKFHDLDIANTVFSGTGTIIASLNLVQMGTTESERVGRKITVVSVSYRGRIIINTKTVPNNATDVCRMIIYLDKQANGGAASVLEILELARYDSFNNLANSSRFRILKNIVMSIDSHGVGYDGATFSTNAASLAVECFINVNIPVEFSGVAGTIGEVNSNNFGILYISAFGQANFQGNTRIRYMG